MWAFHSLGKLILFIVLGKNSFAPNANKTLIIEQVPKVKLIVFYPVRNLYPCYIDISPSISYFLGREQARTPKDLSTGGGIRTHTEGILSPSPLPLGYACAELQGRFYHNYLQV